MTSYNPAVAKLDIPARIRKLPIDERGYPVPKFVAWIDGKPDFRAAEPAWLSKTRRQRLCWQCGEPLGRHLAFVIGPMCAINRVSSETPSHLDCAQFAVQACPFITQPRRPRNPHGLPEEHTKPAGVMIERNPGVTLIWVTRSYTAFRPPGGGTLFKLGEPEHVLWYARGQRATREEIMTSMDAGLPQLKAIAELEGPEAVAALNEEIARGFALLPA